MHTASDFAGMACNGTKYLYEEAGGVGGPISITRTGGGTFSLTGLDAAGVFANNSNVSFPNATSFARDRDAAGLQHLHFGFGA